MRAYSTEMIRRVLIDHEWIRDPGDGPGSCWCGQWITSANPQTGERPKDDFRSDFDRWLDHIETELALA